MQERERKKEFLGDAKGPSPEKSCASRTGGNLFRMEQSEH